MKSHKRNIVKGLCFPSFTTGEVDIGTSTLVPVNQEPALTCLNSTRRARQCRLETPAGTNVPSPNGQQRSHNGLKPCLCRLGSLAGTNLARANQCRLVDLAGTKHRHLVPAKPIAGTNLPRIYHPLLLHSLARPIYLAELLLSPMACQSGGAAHFPQNL